MLLLQYYNQYLVEYSPAWHYIMSRGDIAKSNIGKQTVLYKYSSPIVRPAVDDFWSASTSRTEFPYLHPQKVIASVRVHLSPWSIRPRTSVSPPGRRISHVSAATHRPVGFPPAQRARSFVGQTVKFRRPRFVAVAPPPGACRRHTCTRARRAGVSATMMMTMTMIVITIPTTMIII